MYDSAKIKSELTSLVGFRKAYDPSYPALPNQLATSTSGRTVAGAHPLCTLENLWNTGPEFTKFEAQVDGPAAFFAWLTELRDEAAIFMITELIKSRKMDGANRSLIDSLKLYDGIGAYVDRIVGRSRFVGLEVRVQSQEGLQVALGAIGIQLDKPLAIGLPIYIYHSSRAEPVAELTIPVTSGQSFTWFTPEKLTLLRSNDSGHDSGGVFYIGYYEEDLGDAQAIKRTSSWGKAPCIGCSEWNVQSFKKWSKHVDVIAFSVPSTALAADSNNLFDTGAITYDASNNWGLNLAVTVECDLTDFFISNKSLFADALAGALVLKCLNVIAYSTRMGAISDQTKAIAMADLNENDKSSFAYKWLGTLKALALDFSTINSTCMPKNEGPGVAWGAV